MSTHGGKRKGAGRPPIGKEPLQPFCTKLPEEQIKLLRKYAKRNKRAVASVLREWIPLAYHHAVKGEK